MNRKHEQWRSPSLGRPMDLLIFGDSGTPVLVFSTSTGGFTEWEEQGMIGALKQQIENGYNQVFCVDSVDDESFLNQDVDPYTRIMRYEQYESYILDEVVPYIDKINGHFFLIVTGIGLGAHHAANLLFKYPKSFHKLIGLSGEYDIRKYVADFYDDNVYFNNPVDYLSNLNDQSMLSMIKATEIRLAAGKKSEQVPETKQLSNTLHRKSITHIVDLWESKNEDDWPDWHTIIQNHIA